MKSLFCFILIILISFTACQETGHQSNDQNFSVQRLIIINGNNEILMSNEQSVWAMPSILFNERQFIKEGIDSLSNVYGVEITDLELRGQFSYKYDYKPYATIRNYYVARYVKGELKIPEGYAAVEWVDIPTAIERITVTSIKQSTKQILENPNEVWGGSFMVSHVGDDHPTKMVENFYSLFK